MDIFKNRNFVKLFFAALASQMGSTVGNMAFAFYLLEHFSSKPYYATIAELMYSLPTVFVFVIVGVVADRFDRKKVAENCDWIRAIMTACLFFALFTNSIPLIFFILFLRSAVTKFFYPAESSLVQAILRKDQYAQASGLNQILFSIFLVFGVGLGALAYRTVGIHGAVLVDLISFVLSALLIRSCKIPKSARLPNGRVSWKGLHISSAVSDFLEGIRYILHNRLLTLIIFGFFIFGFVQGSFAVLPLFTMKYDLAPNSYEMYSSLFAIFLGAGLLVGSTVSTFFAKKIKPFPMFVTPIFLTSIFVFLLGFVDEVEFYLSIIFLIGMCIGPVNVAIGGWIPNIVHPKLMGRVSGWIDPLMMFAQSATLLCIALLFPNIIRNIDLFYYGMALIILFVFFFYMILMPKYLKEKRHRLGKNTIKSVL
ncbi:MFS transporter [Aeribacillus sp. FSL M8-0254]|uniref:MFS transporter n=1 Tax=Aeribacillus sp. FSL M8-0254 TaxID=2954577 RepID=UPI0030FB49EE